MLNYRWRNLAEFFMAHEKKQHIEESKSVIQDGIPLFRAEKVKAPFTFKGFWKNARHYATTIEHAQMYLD